jgi:hypothetical protein
VFIKDIYYYEYQNIAYTIRRCATKYPKKKGVYKKSVHEKVIQKRQKGVSLSVMDSSKGSNNIYKKGSNGRLLGRPLLCPDTLHRLAIYRMSNQAATAPGIKKAQIPVVPTSARVLRASDFPVPPLLLLLLALAVVVRLVAVPAGAT